MSQIREQVKSEDKVMKDQSKHQSQSDAAKGFGGKYGVQKERQDKVAKVKYLLTAFGHVLCVYNTVLHQSSACDIVYISHPSFSSRFA